MILRGEKGVPVQTGGAAVYKGMIRAVVLSLIFVGALFGFGAMANHTNEDLTTEMEGATLPVISMYQNGQ